MAENDRKHNRHRLARLLPFCLGRWINSVARRVWTAWPLGLPAAAKPATFAPGAIFIGFACCAARLARMSATRAVAPIGAAPEVRADSSAGSPPIPAATTLVLKLSCRSLFGAGRGFLCVRR